MLERKKELLSTRQNLKAFLNKLQSSLHYNDKHDDGFDQNIDKVVDLCLSVCAVSVPLVRYFVPQFYL